MNKVYLQLKLYKLGVKKIRGEQTGCGVDAPFSITHTARKINTADMTHVHDFEFLKRPHCQIYQY